MVLLTNQLVGAIPAEISGMTSLGFLDISVNFFGPDLQQALFELPALARLNIEINAFVSLLPDTYNLPEIQAMTFRRNNFFGPIPSTLGTLSTLQTLVLRATALTSFMPTVLRNSDWK